MTSLTQPQLREETASYPYLRAQLPAALHFTVRHDGMKAKEYPVRQLQNLEITRRELFCGASSRSSSCSPAAYLLMELPPL